jgi:hypothetical protein
MGTDNGKAAPATVRPFDYLGSRYFVYAPGADLHGSLGAVWIGSSNQSQSFADFAHRRAPGPEQTFGAGGCLGHHHHMICRSLLAVVAGSFLAGCDVNDSLSGIHYARSISERAFALGEGEATVSQVFGAAARTCVSTGDREEAMLDLQAREALKAHRRDPYSVVIVQFDEAGRVLLRRQFHIKNAFAYIDIDEPRSAARCLGPTDVVQVGLDVREHMVGVRIP